MIPKVIHYCWFGGNPLPTLAVKCIESWKKFFPDYEIKEWNESNFNIDVCVYVREAYENRKWAFVSDYARYWILYNEGGIYFDTDVEVIKDMEDILDNGSFMGCEPIGEGEQNAKTISVNCAPGLGMGIKPGHSIVKEILDYYDNLSFINDDGTLNIISVVKHTTDILLQYGWIPNGELQCIDGIYIYPIDYFCPMNYETGKINITQNTHSIHHYTSSWMEEKEIKYHKIQQRMIDRFGYRIGRKIGSLIDFPYRVKRKQEERGWSGMIKFALYKLCKKYL